MVTPYKNLAFAGCGVRNAGYAGGILALEARGLYRDVGAVAGTSAGSIVATLVAVGYPPAEIKQAILDLDFKRITSTNVVRGAIGLVSAYGWHAAEYLEQELGELVGAKTGNPRTSFSDLARGDFMDLRIVAANLTTRRVRVFPDAETQDMALVDAVRISMAIPLFFQSKRVEDDVYVDGGLLWNLPVEAFDTADAINLETLGFMMREPALPARKPIDSTHDYFEALFRTILRGQEADTEFRPTLSRRVVPIDDLGISAVDFQITRDQKQALVEQGISATNAFLDSL